MFRYLMIFCLFLVIFLSSTNFTTTEAYGSNANITIKWDVLLWTPDGYVAVVTIYSFQKHRRIRAPGWKLGWTWAKKEESKQHIKDIAQNLKETSHIVVKKSPTVVDFKPGTPYNQQIEDCCRGGVLASWSGLDQARSRSAFQISVGQAGTTTKTVKMPKKYTFKAPGGVYDCGPAKIVRPSRFYSADRRRVTKARMQELGMLHANISSGNLQHKCFRKVQAASAFSDGLRYFPLSLLSSNGQSWISLPSRKARSKTHQWRSFG